MGLGRRLAISRGRMTWRYSKASSSYFSLYSISVDIGEWWGRREEEGAASVEAREEVLCTEAEAVLN